MKNIYRNIHLLFRLACFALLAIIFMPSEGFSTHIVGGNITYKHVSGDVYQVRLVLRRDCYLGSPEAQFDDPAAIGIFTGGGTLASWLANNGQLKIPFMSSDTLNEYIQSDCGFEGTQVCVHETIYQGNVTLPFRVGGYVLAYQRCCRNASLNNIRDPLETGSTYYVNVTEQALTFKNSSPVFKRWPDVYICANKPLFLDNSATDKDGDSLVYKLCVPSLGATRTNPKPQPPGYPPYNNITWAPPYSLNDMMGGVPLKINSITGEITATPNLVGQFLIGVCVEEYRKGVLLGTVRRDFQFNVRVCSQPPFAKFTTSESNCSGLTVSFFNQSLSSGNYQWDFNYPSTDPAFKSTLKDPVFTFPASGIYNVMLRATRGSDGCFDTVLQKVAVFTNKIVPDFSYALSGCDNNVDSLQVLLSDLSAFNEPGYSIIKWEWTVVQNGITKHYTGKNAHTDLSYTGNVEVTLHVTASNGCASEVVKTIKIEEVVPESDFSYVQIGCISNDSITLQLNNLSSLLNPFGTIESSTWTLGSKTYSGNPLVITVAGNLALLPVTLETRFVGGCSITSTKSFTLQPLQAGFTMSETTCSGLIVSFFNESTGADKFEWNFNYPTSDTAYISSQSNPVFTFPNAGVYNILLTATRSSDGCQDTILQKIAVFNNKIIPDFSYVLSDCNEQNDSLVITLKDLSVLNEPGYVINSRTWTVIQNGLTRQFTDSTALVSLSYSGDVSIKLVVSANNGCITSIEKEIPVTDLVPRSAFEYSLVGCPANDIIEIEFNNISGPLNPFATIESSIWTIGSQTFVGNPLKVTFPVNTSLIDVTLKTGFAGGCALTISKSIDLALLLPIGNYTYSPVNCPDGNTVKISLNYDGSQSNNIQATSVTWLAGTSAQQASYTGEHIEIILPKDSVMYLQMFTSFANGCVDTLEDSFLPGPFASIKFNGDTIILCPNQVKNMVENPNSAWTYTWSPTTGLDLTDPSNPKVSVSANTTYRVTVTDGLCTVESAIEVVVLQGGVNLSIQGDTSSCDGKVSFIASGGVGQGTYTWGTDPSITNVIGTGTTINTVFSGASQTYYVQFAGESCSTMPATITVKNETPSVENVSPYTICKGDTTKIISVNLIPYHVNTFTWDTNTHIVSGGNTPNPTIGVGANEDQPFILYYTVKNQFGCTLRDSVLFVIGQNPSVDFDIALKECGKNVICFTLNGSYQGFIKWNFGDPSTTNDMSIEKTPCYTYPVPGTFNVTLENLVSVCPFKDVSKTVMVNPPITLQQLPDKIVCYGDSLKLSAASNIQNTSFTWYDIQGNVLGAGPSYGTILTEDKKFIVQGKDNFGCSDSDTIMASVFKFNFTLQVKDSVCINEPAQITLNIQNPENFEYVWSPSSAVISGGNTYNPIILAGPDQTIKVNIKHLASGCKDSASVTPKVTKPFSFEITGPPVFCLKVPTSLTLTIDNPEKYNYIWSPAECFQSGITTPNPIAVLSADKVLKVVVTNIVSGCKQQKDFAATAGEDVTVTVDAQPDFTIYEGQDLDIFVTDTIEGATYQWSTGQSGTLINVKPVVTTTYTVTATDSNGCTATAEVTVTVRLANCDETDVYIPNAFSPNNDGNNDVLYVRSNFIDEMELIIYNRWGQEVFHTKDKAAGWDGTFKGEELPADAFAYYLRVLCVNAKEYKKKGNVSLLR